MQLTSVSMLETLSDQKRLQNKEKELSRIKPQKNKTKQEFNNEWELSITSKPPQDAVKIHMDL